MSWSLKINKEYISWKDKEMRPKLGISGSSSPDGRGVPGKELYNVEVRALD